MNFAPIYRYRDGISPSLRMSPQRLALRCLVSVKSCLSAEHGKRGEFMMILKRLYCCLARAHSGHHYASSLATWTHGTTANTYTRFIYCWCNSVQKALRMVDPTIVEGFQPRSGGRRTREQLERNLARPTDLRMFSIAQVHCA